LTSEASANQRLDLVVSNDEFEISDLFDERACFAIERRCAKMNEHDWGRFFALPT
jgi:hypothetical protein